MNGFFTEIPISDLRVNLSKIKRKVQLGHERVAACYYGEIVGLLVPLDDISHEKNIPIDKSLEMSLSEFRDSLTICWEKLQTDVDCIYLTFHNRRVVAFLSPRLAAYLPLNLDGSKVAETLSNLSGQDISKQGAK